MSGANIQAWDLSNQTFKEATPQVKFEFYTQEKVGNSKKYELKIKKNHFQSVTFVYFFWSALD